MRQRVIGQKLVSVSELCLYCKDYINVFCFSGAEDKNGNSEGSTHNFQMMYVVILAIPKHLTVYLLQVIKEGRIEEEEVVVVSVRVG